MSELDSHLAAQFDDPNQQQEAATTGFWIIIAAEELFFGGLFLAYTAYRTTFPEAFALASKHTEVGLGGINTAILLTSSLTMALAVYFSKKGRRKPAALYLMGTAALGVFFLGVKALEYYADYRHHLVPGLDFFMHGKGASEEELFFFLYFVMTGIHALHVMIGVCVVGAIASRTWRGFYTEKYHTPVELTGLYWHFVDIVWIFLFPLLYLVDRYS